MAETKPDNGSNPNTPLWVKVFGIVAAVVFILFVITLLTGGKHGPWRHMRHTNHTASLKTVQYGLQQR